VLRLRELYFIDSDGADALAEIIDIVKSQNRQIAISGVNTFTIKPLEQIKAFQTLKKSGLVFSKTEEALGYIKHNYPNK
jgi:anti-anti-sigma regulatory factor